MKILKIRNPYYSATKEGKTHYIGRAGDSGIKDYWNMLLLNEKIMLQLVDDKDNDIKGENFEVNVRKMRKYPSIEDACKEIGAEKLLPGIKSVEEAVKIYYSFPDYKKRIETQNFIVIEIEK